MANNGIRHRLVAIIPSLLACVMTVALFFTWRARHEAGVFSSIVAVSDRHFRIITDQNTEFKLMLDPFLVFRNQPNQFGTYTINSQGFRVSEELKIAKHKGIILGGSTAFGWNVHPYGKTFAGILNDQFPQVEIVNAAVVGYLSGQELGQMVHYATDLHPDFYLILDAVNDLMDELVLFPNRHSWELGVNNLFFGLNDALYQYRFGKTKEAGVRIPEVSFEVVKDRYLENLEKMIRIAKAQNSQIAVFFSPELGEKQNRTPNENRYLDDMEHKLGYLSKGIPSKYRSLVAQAIRLCKRYQVPYLDLHPAFQKNIKEEHFLDLAHFSELGHERIAEMMAEFLPGKVDAIRPRRIAKLSKSQNK